MTTSVDNDSQQTKKTPKETVRRLLKIRLLRELLIILVFCFFTSLVTWPYVSRLRDAVVGPGDPYLVTWMLWWDYHQTFHDPVNLFHGNVFYPYRYNLAFSETAYGVALPFFPLLALGFRPLTVHAIAIFLGFALSGYTAFRLTRTLTGSNGAAWVSGIIFAFIPYRFNMMAQLLYQFSIWVPVLFEALILFVRQRSWKRAAWLGFAFFMTGLTTITWLMLAIIPLVVIAAILLTRHELWKERAFWIRSAASIATACVALLPFTIPFYIVSKMYGFKRRVEDVEAHSAYPMHWLVAEGRNRVWRGMGATFPDAGKFQLFPGLLALLLPLAEVFRSSAAKLTNEPSAIDVRHQRWIRRLDIFIVIALGLSIIGSGFGEIDYNAIIFQSTFKSEHALGLLSIGIIARLCLSYPNFLRRSENRNLIETLRSKSRDDAFWVGVVLTVIGFVYSLGWHFFFYRLIYDFAPGFRSIRAPMRGSLFAYLGLAVLSGMGSRRIANYVSAKRSKIPPAAVFAVFSILLLVELNCAPLFFIRGEVFPDQVTMRIKQTDMRGGLMYFPVAPDFNTRYMLRAADHGKQLILGNSGFLPPNNLLIEKMTLEGPIPVALMDLLEKIPASYLIVENKLMPEERRQDYQKFVVQMVRAGRLRFVNRFDEANDMYAVVKTEPQVKQEAPLPFDLSVRDWAGTINDDPVRLLGKLQPWSQKLYRIHFATTGTMPRYKQFMNNMNEITRGVIVGSDDEDKQLDVRFEEFIGEWVKHEEFAKEFAHLDNTQFVDRLLKNAALADDGLRQSMITGLEKGIETRATVLLKIVDDARFVESEKDRSLVDLYYFGYLRRNPDDPPDNNLEGFYFWLQDMKRWGPGKLGAAFEVTDEYKHFQKAKASP